MSFGSSHLLLNEAFSFDARVPPDAAIKGASVRPFIPSPLSLPWKILTLFICLPSLTHFGRFVAFAAFAAAAVAVCDMISLARLFRDYAAADAAAAEHNGGSRLLGTVQSRRRDSDFAARLRGLPLHSCVA